MKKLTMILFCMLIPIASYSQSTLVGGPCEGCEAVFEYGDRTLTPADTLPGFEENNHRLKISGTIYQADGKTPAENVILYIYHTNQKGVYPTRGDEQGWARRHGYIRGWVKTDSEGKYAFYTFKPGSYGSNSAHIHATILEPNGKYYYIDEYRFKGDPELQNVSNHIENRGGSGIIEPEQSNGILLAHRDIILGKNINGYDRK